ncbi:MAG TPA: hypothetical protein VFU23_00355, partial [Gemmatimonadales bacterium]|nr:hypothetical protein [Gemmatimonadales bacterium]
MRQSLIIISLLGLGAALASCGPATPTTETTNLTTGGYAVLGNDFSGNYVKIIGLRSVPADGKYPCLNQFEVCLGLDPAGATAAVQDLCPSDDTPEGTWTFSYVLYTDAQCTAALENIGCVPDQGEWLSPGHNYNDVVCLTRNADKSWDFCVMDPVTGAG